MLIIWGFRRKVTDNCQLMLIFFSVIVDCLRGVDYRRYRLRPLIIFWHLRLSL
jgi:hypothetical protein